MILQSLVQYYEDLLEQNKVSQLGWCEAKVSHVIELSEDGSIKGIIYNKEEVDMGKKKVWISKVSQVPQMVTRSSGVSANFLCDNAKYFLGIDESGTNERTMECFQAAKEKHLSILNNLEDPIAKAICRYFESWNPKTAKENTILKEYWDELNEGGNLIFSMRGHDAQENEAIKKAWEEYQSQAKSDLEKTGICLVTGKKAQIARIHRGIKGVPGAQSSGAALVSFNAPAFESYGKEQSYNAPVGKYAEFAYTTALNYLLSKREYCFSLGDSMIVFWAESAKEEYQDMFLSFLNPKPDNQKEMQKVFENLKRGVWVDLEDIKINPEQNFYILALAPNAARLSVRFFYQNSFGNILINLAKHYERMKMVKPAWEERDYLGTKEILDETVNQKSRDKTPIPSMATMVLRAILEDTKYPASLYTDILIRIRAEQGKITYARASIVKALLIKNYQWKEGEDFMGLNEDYTGKAYVLGRMFAVLEYIQRGANQRGKNGQGTNQQEANREINTTIRDRYFNSACTTPASVFPILLKLKNSHMKKIERDSMGKKIYYEELLTEVMEKLPISENMDAFPKQLSLEEQGEFMLGYYHQVQKLYTKKEAKTDE